MTPSMNELSIAFVGDVYVGETSCPQLAESVAEVFTAADVVVANQEGPITECTLPVGGKACLKSGLMAAEMLRDWGVHVVSLANNHMFDFGWEGFEQTRRVLDDMAIAHVGAGRDLAEAMTPHIVEANGLRVGLLAFAASETQATCAGHDAFGCAPLNERAMLEAVRALNGRVDAIVVMPHWGYCEYTLPTPEQVTLAGQLLDTGATAVVGHHSHTVQGLVERKRLLVAYSLGNFAFTPFIDRGRRVDLTRENHQGVVLTLRLKQGRVASHSILHTIQRDNVIERDESDRRTRVLVARSSALDAPNYADRWRRSVRRRMILRMFHWANPARWRNLRWATLRAGWLMIKRMFR